MIKIPAVLYTIKHNKSYRIYSQTIYTQYLLPNKWAFLFTTKTFENDVMAAEYAVKRIMHQDKTSDILYVISSSLFYTPKMYYCVQSYQTKQGRKFNFLVNREDYSMPTVPNERVISLLKDMGVTITKVYLPFQTFGMLAYYQGVKQWEMESE